MLAHRRRGDCRLMEVRRPCRSLPQRVIERRCGGISAVAANAPNLHGSVSFMPWRLQRHAAYAVQLPS